MNPPSVPAPARLLALRRTMARYAPPHLRLMVITGVAAFIGLTGQVAVPAIMKSVVDLADLLARGRLPQSHVWDLLPPGLELVGLGLLIAAANLVRRRLANELSMRMETDLRNDFYRHLQRLTVAFHDNWQSGQLLSRAIYDINTIRRFVGFGLVIIGISVYTFIAVFFQLVRLDPMLAMVSFLVLSPVGYLTLRFERQYRLLARAVQDQQGDLGTIIEEAATGIRIIKAFGRGDTMLSRFSDQAAVLRGTSLRAVRSRAHYWSWLALLPNAAVVAILLFGGVAVTQGHLSIGGLVAFLAYLTMLVFPLELLGWILAMGEEAVTAAERVFEVLDTEPVVVERAGALDLVECSGAVSFDDVWFRYDQERDWVLRGFSLEIRPGETMALVGLTGSGKTTAAMLVARMYDAVEGAVRLDGHDLRDLTLSSLRSHLGFAFEDPVLFSASARENLILGRPRATDAEIEEALHTAHVDFVDALPFGLDTRVGEQGYTLSGGQRQRLALARAVLGRPQVLVLDDPLSAVDVHTEAQIETALATILRGVTALLVVHRPSTLALADRVALVDGGRVVAVGTHHQLMEQEPLYRDILSMEAETPGGASSREAG
ncbi:MAG: ABC transporter ATP-binding protein [Candidatus Dormibacteria bacterium]